MRAAVFHSAKNISYDIVYDPKIKNSCDVIIKVTSAAICGSDLHIYNCLFSPGKIIV